MTITNLKSAFFILLFTFLSCCAAMGQVSKPVPGSPPAGAPPSGAPAAGGQPPGGAGPSAGGTSSGPTPPATATVITIDLKSRTLTGNIPFDRPFYLVVSDTSKVKTVAKIIFRLSDGLDVGRAVYVQISESGKAFGNNFYLPFTSFSYHKGMLLPNHTYTLKLEAYDNKNNPLPDYSFIYGFYTQTQAGEFAQVDFGLGYAPHLKSLIGFSTVNFYFTAINSDADLQEIHGFKRNFFLRFSVFMGISPLTLSQATTMPMVNRFSLGNFVFGAAIRSPFYGYYTTDSRVGQELLQPMRLTIGELLFKQNSANPLITTPQNKGAIYVGISYDLNLSSILGPVGKLLSP